MIVAREQEFRGFARFWIPETDGAVFAARGQCAAIRREHQRADVGRMPTQRTQEASGLDIPHADVPIDAAADNGLAIGSVGDGPYAMRMAAEGLEFSEAGLPILQMVNGRCL